MSPASGDFSFSAKLQTLGAVSIQLMSPASGDCNEYWLQELQGRAVSIQLMSPASGDIWWLHARSARYQVSIQLMSPASGDSG
jgi:hypothetical protein